MVACPHLPTRKYSSISTLAGQLKSSFGNNLLGTDQKRLTAIIQAIGKCRGAHTNASHLIRELEVQIKAQFAREDIVMEGSKVLGLAIHSQAQAKFIEWL